MKQNYIDNLVNFRVSTDQYEDNVITTIFMNIKLYIWVIN